jgi:hypothetical protein
VCVCVCVCVCGVCVCVRERERERESEKFKFQMMSRIEYYVRTSHLHFDAPISKSDAGQHCNYRCRVSYISQPCLNKRKQRSRSPFVTYLYSPEYLVETNLRSRKNENTKMSDPACSVCESAYACIFAFLCYVCLGCQRECVFVVCMMNTHAHTRTNACVVYVPLLYMS